MQIAQICFRFGAPGGVENYVYHISKELIRRGHEVTVFTSNLYSEEPWKKFDKAHDELNGLKIKRLNVYKNLFPIFKMPIIPDVISGLIKSNADIYHAHSHRYTHLLSASLAHRVTNAPFIVTTYYHPPEKKETIWKKIHLRVGDIVFKNEVYRYASKVITMTDTEKNYLKGLMPIEKCVTIPAGISSSDWKDIPDGSLFREKYRIKGPFILYAGRLASNKGLEYLVEAAHIVTKDNNVKFVFVGEDWGEKEKLTNLATKLGIQDKIIFTDYIDNFEIYKSAFYECEIFVLPSEWESFGIVLLEAMVCGKPCIATNVGGVPEIVDNGVNGFIVPYRNSEMLASKICMLLENNKLRTEFGVNGRKKVLAGYTWDKIVDTLETVYEEVLERHKQR
ncbi:MAG: glycosyltransferase family 4 protein [Candidatus Thermoplasmatota archaeon]|nr:glycosyltransferase family 4 protein [Candidatus Thermoplasmatota archaeon]